MVKECRNQNLNSFTKRKQSSDCLWRYQKFQHNNNTAIKAHFVLLYSLNGNPFKWQLTLITSYCYHVYLNIFIFFLSEIIHLNWSRGFIKLRQMCIIKRLYSTKQEWKIKSKKKKKIENYGIYTFSWCQWHSRASNHRKGDLSSGLLFEFIHFMELFRENMSGKWFFVVLKLRSVAANVCYWFAWRKLNSSTLKSDWFLLCKNHSMFYGEIHKNKKIVPLITIQSAAIETA